jgi:hypothetical protein
VQFLRSIQLYTVGILVVKYFVRFGLVVIAKDDVVFGPVAHRLSKAGRINQKEG